jgi:hypothetical protein
MLPFWHPRVGGSYVANLSAPSFHPDVHANLTAALAGIMPARHPNVTNLIFNVTRTPLPGDHPPIDPWLGMTAKPSYTPYRCAELTHLGLCARSREAPAGSFCRFGIPPRSIRTAWARRRRRSTQTCTPTSPVRLVGARHTNRCRALFAAPADRRRVPHQHHRPAQPSFRHPALPKCAPRALLKGRAL